MRVSKLLIFILFSCLLIVSCKPTNYDGCPNVPSFSAQIQPIMQQNCATASCHGYGGFAPFGLNTHSEVDSAALNTNFILAIKHQTPLPMPRVDPFLPDATLLPDSIIQIIECWVNQGRPNN
jgi:hypothetical protein